MASAENGSHTGGSGSTPVLIVDDEVVITELVGATLTGRGYACRLAHSGPEALEKLAEEEAALVLTDVRMPGMSGLDLLEQVRVHYPDTFVLLLTGAADVPTVVRALRAGACDFLTKPFSLADLLERVRVAGERRAQMLAERETHLRRQERLDRLTERYRHLAEGAVSALTLALGAKHPETRAHSERVAARAARLAETLGLSGEDVQAVYVAGLLHDIGKVAVESKVLDKPGRLSAREAETIRSHPVQSATIAAPVALSPVTLEAIRHHHERYDGQGYPDHLAGEAIPYAARILAVCDAYDAMTWARAYHAAVPVEEGLERLRQGAGHQWDPHVVEAFCRAARDDG